ncbi:MAG: YlxR family protein [Clostridia bacterium]|nr:YlxR family protein [Clostridia bacterium]
MKKKKIPMRRCVGCMESKPKKELIRIVCNKENILSLDSTGKAAGRGVYLCKSTECFEKARKRKSIERSLERQISSDNLNEIFEALKGHE